MAKKNIIILHGWGSQPQNWQKVAERIRKENYQVFIPYLPGFDENNPIKKPYTLADYSQWLLQFINQKKINQAILVGHSNGGRIAAYFCATNQDKVEKLILIGSAGIPAKNKIKTAIFQSASRFGKAFFKILNNKKIFNLGQKILYKLAGESDYLKASPVMRKTMINMLAADLTPQFSQIKCPTLIIWGKKDSYTPFWMGERIRQLIKNSQLKVIDNGRHGLNFTHAEELSKLITKFVHDTQGSNINQHPVFKLK